METIKNNRSGYRTREKAAAVPHQQQTGTTLTREEVMACLNNAEPNGYMNWKLPSSNPKAGKGK